MVIEEMNNFIKLCLYIIISLCYCYFIGKTKIIPKRIARLVCFLPVICLFLFIPLGISSIHLRGIIAFFITWLANFKILLFAFDKGPLSPPSLSLPTFLLLACFPIKIQQYPSPKSYLSAHDDYRTLVKYAIKILLFASLLHIYDYSNYIHPTMMYVLYFFHIYFFLELVLALVATLARALLCIELEKQFDEPYLSASLQDFWGKRWNIMVTSILRPTVYEPVLNMSTRFVGRKWAPLPAVFGTFVVSGIMHELIFYYLGRMRPTWEITWFFLLHGVCLMAEIALKKTVDEKWWLPKAVSMPLTIGFFMLTSFWLAFPPLLRCKADERALEEYAVLGAFLKNVTALTFSAFQF